MKVNKQGVELEINVFKKNSPPFIKDLSLHEHATRLFKEVRDKVYLDDGKPEYPSWPHSTLGDLEEDLSESVTRFLRIAERERMEISLVGNFPFFYDFCSGHIHTSVTSKNVTWLDLRKKLYNAQPLIAYASANSPILEGNYRASDVRLAFSSWSDFVEYDDTSQSHWSAITMGEGGETIECRIPSAGPLFQIIGIAAMIRSIIENEEPISPILNTKEIWKNVIIYGSKAIVPILLPKKVHYYGYTTRKVFVKMSDLFKLYLQEQESYLKEQLSTCSSIVRSEVMEFYRLLASGVTLSDIILTRWFKSKDKLEVVDFIVNMTRESYSRRQFTDKLVTGEIVEGISPNVKTITLEEFKEILKSLNLEELLDSNIQDLMKILVLYDPDTIKKTIQRILGNSKESAFLIYGGTRLVEDLVQYRVLTLLGGRYVPDRNYPYLMQIVDGVGN